MAEHRKYKAVNIKARVDLYFKKEVEVDEDALRVAIEEAISAELGKLSKAELEDCYLEVDSDSW